MSATVRDPAQEKEDTCLCFSLKPASRTAPLAVWYSGFDGRAADAAVLKKGAPLKGGALFHITAHHSAYGEPTAPPITFVTNTRAVPPRGGRVPYDQATLTLSLPLRRASRA